MFCLIERKGVTLLVSDNIKSKHGFSTRLGGVSTHAHTGSLNLAFGRGDNEEVVMKNVELFANAVGFDEKLLISVPQVHSNEVRHVGIDDVGYGVSKKSPFECDGYVATEQGIPIGVKTADCVPILLEARDDDGNVIAVAAVHAGWRGTAARIISVALDKLCFLGAKRENIYVAIGPCIDECCYEVGEDFTYKIAEKLGQNYENKYIIKRENLSLYANLKGMNRAILLESGIPEENIDVCAYCTHCEEKLFYSHRRQNGLRGSMMSVIVM